MLLHKHGVDKYYCLFSFFSTQSECKMPPRKADVWKSVPNIPVTRNWQDDPLSLAVLNLFGCLGTYKPLLTTTFGNAKDKMQFSNLFLKHDIVKYVLY